MNTNIQRIIDVANELQRRGRTGASTGEKIAAAFVLNNMDYLPANYRDVVEAWERLDDWQRYVHIIKRDHMELINLPPWEQILRGLRPALLSSPDRMAIELANSLSLQKQSPQAKERHSFARAKFNPLATIERRARLVRRERQSTATHL